MNRENFKVFKAIIIGGGMAGLTSAIILSKKFGGENIAVVEGQNRVGKKILSTGNGQCNLTNLDLSLSHFHSKNSEFFKHSIEKYDNNQMISFFNELGVLTTFEDDKVYPLSKQSSSVLDALRFKLESLNTRLFLGSKAIRTIKEKCFKVSLENGEVLEGENLIIAVGGKSSSHLGTDGTSYNLLTSFGHSLTNLYPSLVQLKTDKAKIKGMKGLKLKANVKAVINGKTAIEKEGEVLFTDYGVSGNAIFFISSYVVDKKAKLVLDLVPNLSKEELNGFLTNKVKNCPYLTLENLLSGIINNKIASAVLRNNGFSDLNEKISCSNLEKIVNLVKNYEIDIVGSMGFDNSQVTKGGISVNEFNPLTLESNLISNLYAVGEVLDVDGDCGGYNLQWAFSSASAVSYSIK